MMVKPAGRAISLSQLRFKPANSNEFARADLAHAFSDVPPCSAERDEGLRHYLASTVHADDGLVSPEPQPGETSANAHAEPEPIFHDAAKADRPLHRKLLRSGFAMSAFLHVSLAIALGLATLILPEDAVLEEGVTSVTLVVEGNADADALSTGEETTEDDPQEQAEEPTEVSRIETPEVKPDPRPIEPVEQAVVAASAATILQDVPLPVLGAQLPEILAAQTKAEQTVEAAAKAPPETKSVPADAMTEPAEQTVEKPVAEKIVEQKLVEKVPEPKPARIEKPRKALEKKPTEKKADKEKPRPKKNKRGNKGDQASNARRGKVDADEKGQTATSSRGDPGNHDTGNAARSSYLGLVNKKLARARGRTGSPAKGKVEVTFTILAGGAISGLKVSRSSGKPTIDAAALKVVRMASPFAAIPPETGRKRWPMRVPMTFK